MYKIAVQTIFSSQKLMTYFKLSLAADKHKVIILTLPFNLNNNDNDNNNEEKNNMFTLHIKTTELLKIRE